MPAKPRQVGVELSQVLKSQESKGMKVVENDLILDPERLLPPPRMKGQVTAVRLEGDRIIQTFGSKGRARSPPPTRPTTTCTTREES